MTPQRNGAALYCRVSTAEQAEDPFNLAKQEKLCRDLCERKGLRELVLFVDAGVSGRYEVEDRPEFEKMLAYCKANRQQVGYVVIQDLSRLARNSRVQGQFIAELEMRDIELLSVYEPQIGKTAAGKLAAGIIGNFNQYFSDSLSERMHDRMIAAVQAGRWPWPAPFGYLNVDSVSGANIVPDPERAPLIRKAFELVKDGWRQVDVVVQLRSEGLRARKGGKITRQYLNRILTNRAYAGWISPSSAPDLCVKGQHQPLVSQELFDDVQLVLSGKRPKLTPKSRLNPDFPLRGIVRCGSCGAQLTAANCKGRTKVYGHYWCWRCGASKISKGQLESQFVALLRRLKPRPEVVSSFPSIAAKVWNRKQGDAEATERKLRTRLEDRKKLKSELLKAKLRGEVSQVDYESANREYTAEIAEIEGQLQGTQQSKATLEQFIRFSELMLVDIAAIWERAGSQHRHVVQSLLFSSGLDWAPERKDFEPRNYSLFNVLENMTTENKQWLLR